MKLEVDEAAFNKVKQEYEGLKEYISFHRDYVRRAELLVYIFESMIVDGAEKDL